MQHEKEKSGNMQTEFWKLSMQFTLLVFTTTGGMAAECLRYHGRLAELIADKKAESSANTISWIRAKEENHH